MLEPRKGLPYLWVTHFTGLLSGEQTCEWQTWVKAHYKFSKTPDDGGSEALSRWSERHTALLRTRASMLEADGWEVALEDQNKFTVRGRAITVGGKPDIVAYRGSEVLISDPKGGSQKNAYPWQVRTYMMLLPMVDDRIRAASTVRGEVVYPSVTGDLDNPLIVAVSLSDADSLAITGLLHGIATMDEPRPRPSEGECRFCKVADCPDRWSGGGREGDAGGLF